MAAAASSTDKQDFRTYLNSFYKSYDRIMSAAEFKKHFESSGSLVVYSKLAVSLLSTAKKESTIRELLSDLAGRQITVSSADCNIAGVHIPNSESPCKDPYLWMSAARYQPITITAVKA